MGDRLLKEMGAASRAWMEFIKCYSVIEPGTAFDLQGDPPQFIRALNSKILEYCGDNGIEVDNPPLASQLL